MSQKQEKKFRRSISRQVESAVKDEVTNFKTAVNQMKFLERAVIAVRVLRGRV